MAKRRKKKMAGIGALNSQFGQRSLYLVLGAAGSREITNLIAPLLNPILQPTLFNVIPSGIFWTIAQAAVGLVAEAFIPGDIGDFLALGAVAGAGQTFLVNQGVIKGIGAMPKDMVSYKVNGGQQFDVVAGTQPRRTHRLNGGQFNVVAGPDVAQGYDKNMFAKVAGYNNGVGRLQDNRAGVPKRVAKVIY